MFTMDIKLSGEFYACCEKTTSQRRLFVSASIEIIAAVTGGAEVFHNAKGERIHRDGHYKNGKDRWRNDKGQFSSGPVKSKIEELLDAWNPPRSSEFEVPDCPEKLGFSGSVSIVFTLSATWHGFGGKGTMTWRVWEPEDFPEFKAKAGYVGGGTKIVAKLELIGSLTYSGLF